MSLAIVPAVFQPFFCASRFSEYVYASGDNEGLGVFLFTVPTFAALGYSIGMLLKWVENRSPRFGSARLRLAILGVWLATFAVAAPLMRNLEHRMVERDRKIRIAATSVLIASDLTQVCGPDRYNVGSRRYRPSERHTGREP